jgi:peptide-methionine (S)-S-oxide reductase
MNNIQENVRTKLASLLVIAGLLACAFASAPILRAEPEAANTSTNLESAVFGGGCFWCGQAVFQRIPGVKAVTAGFAGGTTVDPTYEDVCTDKTGHAETVKIDFDPSVISYKKLLEIFWEAHDPTTLNQQGADRGTQYRSIILYNSEAQKKAAEKSKAEAAKNFSRPIVTQIVPLAKFYPADRHHQNYYNEHEAAGYCQFVIRPKLQKLIDKGVLPPEKN